MLTDAQIRAQKKYDLENKNNYKGIYLKLNRESDADIIDKLDSEDNIQGYIKELIRKDIKA